MELADQDQYIQEHVEELSQTIEKIKSLIESIPFENVDENYIQEYLNNNDIDHFIDPSFPPDDTSIWDWSGGEQWPLKEKPVWKRAKDFTEGTPELFLDGIEPNDIVQGALGDWWFLASIASIAENPALIRRLFITQNYNEWGFYKLKIWKDGEWVEVVVDDYFPWHLNGYPMFTRGRGDELWVLLLEKAYAKLHGNYCAIFILNSSLKLIIHILETVLKNLIYSYIYINNEILKNFVTPFFLWNIFQLLI